MDINSAIDMTSTLIKKHSVTKVNVIDDFKVEVYFSVEPNDIYLRKKIKDIYRLLVNDYEIYTLDHFITENKGSAWFVKALFTDDI